VLGGRARLTHPPAKDQRGPGDQHFWGRGERSPLLQRVGRNQQPLRDRKEPQPWAGSFFPSSAAVNPALTIMANALCVGDHLARRLGN